MKYLIAIDPGHGLDTPGKRTPAFSDGTFMKEREFNAAVARRLKLILEKNGFDVLNVAESDSDVPLKTRTDLANNRLANKFNRKADFYLSIHANAFGNGLSFNSANGIESYVHTSVLPGEKAEVWGMMVNNTLVQAAGRLNRGLKRANFHVLRETLMPAVLVECGFMTNLEEAELLRSGSYREKVAEALAGAIDSIFGVKEAEIPDVKPDYIPEWQRESFKKIVGLGIIRTPEYWAERLSDKITIGELCGIIANMYPQK